MKFPNIPIPSIPTIPTIPDSVMDAVMKSVTINTVFESEEMKRVMEVIKYNTRAISMPEELKRAIEQSSIAASVLNNSLINRHIEITRQLAEAAQISQQFAETIKGITSTYQHVVESPYYKEEYSKNPSNKEVMQAIEANTNLLNDVKVKLQEIEEKANVSEQLNTKRYRIGLLITFLLFIYPMLEKYFTVTDIEKLQLDMDEIRGNQEKIMKLLTDSSCKTLKTKASVSIQPKSKSQRIDTLYPNQIVFVIDTSKKWLNIQFVSPKSGETKEGWVLKKTAKSIRIVW